MVGWHHRLGRQESERTPGGSVGQELGVLQSLGLQRVGHTQGLNKNHCPALVGDLNLQRRGCVIQVSVTCPAQSLTLPLRTTWKAALPEAGAPPGEQPSSCFHSRQRQEGGERALCFSQTLTKQLLHFTLMKKRGWQLCF